MTKLSFWEEPLEKVSLGIPWDRMLLEISVKEVPLQIPLEKVPLEIPLEKVPRQVEREPQVLAKDTSILVCLAQPTFAD